MIAPVPEPPKEPKKDTIETAEDLKGLAEEMGLDVPVFEANLPLIPEEKKDDRAKSE